MNTPEKEALTVFVEFLTHDYVMERTAHAYRLYWVSPPCEEVQVFCQAL
jgi:hypothetical protein